MNQNSGFSLEPISQDQLLVTVALVLVGILALLTVAGMIWGARLKRRRTAAAEEEQRRIEDLEASGVKATHGGDAPARRHDDEAPADRTAPAPHAQGSDARHAPEPAAAPAPSLSDEPIAAAAPLDASPATVADPAPATDAAAPEQTPVTQLKGLGPRIAARLAELGITTVGQLAWLDDAEAQALDVQLGPFSGRMERDRWREQARLLAQGDRAGFERAFGRLG